jgi:protease IV
MNFNESIFKGLFRSLFKTIGAIVGLAIGLGVVFFIAIFFSGASSPSPKTITTILTDGEGNRDLLPTNTPAILYINFHGVIGVNNLTKEKIRELLFQSRLGLLEKDRVKAVVLDINSPGGTVVDATSIHDQLLHYKATYKVPIYAYVDGLCASGGMYIASAADKIYATAPSIIGSVGVIVGPFFNFSEAMSTHGIEANTLTAGKDKDELNPFRPWKCNEGDALKTITEGMYEQFVTAVCNARPMLSKEKLINVYGSNVFLAQEAQNLGYIDIAEADYAKTLTDLVQVLQIKGKYQVIELAHEHSFFDKFSPKNFAQEMLNILGVPISMRDPLKGRPLYLYEP